MGASMTFNLQYTPMHDPAKSEKCIQSKRVLDSKCKFKQDNTNICITSTGSSLQFVE